MSTTIYLRGGTSWNVESTIEDTRERLRYGGMTTFDLSPPVPGKVMVQTSELVAVYDRETSEEET